MPKKKIKIKEKKPKIKELSSKSELDSLENGIEESDLENFNEFISGADTTSNDISPVLRPVGQQSAPQFRRQTQAESPSEDSFEEGRTLGYEAPQRRESTIYQESSPAMAPINFGTPTQDDFLRFQRNLEAGGLREQDLFRKEVIKDERQQTYEEKQKEQRKKRPWEP